MKRKTTAMIEHSDEAVEKILTGLRNAEPDAGLERRILATLDAHASRRSRSPWLALWPLRPIAAIAFACAIVAIAVFIFITAHHRPRQAARTHAPASQIDGTQAHSQSEELSPPRKYVSVAHRTTVHSTKLLPASSSASPHAADNVSFPTPPLPLTAQELLLLQIVHRRSPKLPLVNPDAQAAQAAREAKQFEEFFTPEPSVVINESPAL